jgi:hypothetical protein
VQGGGLGGLGVEERGGGCRDGEGEEAWSTRGRRDTKKC